MEVILIKDVDKIGKKNELISVKNGYGRNYLIPQGYAVVANPSNKRQWEERVKRQKVQEEEQRAQLQEIADKLKKSVIKVGAKVGQENKIFGSVTSVQLAAAIKQQTGAEVDRRDIELMEEAKSLGTYKAKVNLFKDLSVDINYEIVEE